MPFSVRLDPETQALIERLAKRHRQSRAWVVREAVAKYAVGDRSEQSLYERMKPYIGIVSSGDGTLSQDTGKKFTEIVKAKARARRAR
jgi:hypothetical protein